MNVKLCVGSEGRSYWNIIWHPALEMRAGRFPATHPCHDDPTPTVFEPGPSVFHSGSLGRFRAMGYFASCFPEGDGIAFKPLKGQEPNRVRLDVEACFPGMKVRTVQR